MDEISNKTLAFLLIGAIVISLGGTLISMNKLKDIASATGLITSDKTNGTITLTVNQSVAINVTDDTIALGTIDFGGTATSDVGSANDVFTVENIGSVDIILEAWDLGGPWGNGTGGFWPQVADNPTGGCMDDNVSVGACYRVKCEDNDVGSGCDLVAYASVSANSSAGGGNELADQMHWEDSKDTIDVFVSVTVPTAVRNGSKSSVMRFNARAAAVQD